MATSSLAAAVVAAAAATSAQSNRARHDVGGRVRIGGEDAAVSERERQQAGSGARDARSDARGRATRRVMRSGGDTEDAMHQRVGGGGGRGGGHGTASGGRRGKERREAAHGHGTASCARPQGGAASAVAPLRLGTRAPGRPLFSPQLSGRQHTLTSCWKRLRGGRRGGACAGARGGKRATRSATATTEALGGDGSGGSRRRCRRGGSGAPARVAIAATAVLPP